MRSSEVKWSPEFKAHYESLAPGTERGPMPQYELANIAHKLGLPGSLLHGARYICDPDEELWIVWHYTD